MMVPKLEDIVAGIRGRIADPARQAIAVQLATDVAQLQARALAGEDVDAELRHAKAQALSLTATEAGVVLDTVMTWVGSVAGGVARAVLVAAAAG